MSITRNDGNRLFSKVPQVTLFFWLIKILCTTVGETLSDFLSVNVGLGLRLTTLIMGILFVIVLFIQFRTSKYQPFIYWLTVVLISVFGTLVTDNMTDGFGVPLEQSTILFSALLGLAFILWYASEKTLSIHSIFTVRREAFYWLTILFTFALGTAVGDLYSEQLGFGYLKTGIIVLMIIAGVFLAWKLKLNEILAFWIAYIFTRPLGASLGDYLSQSKTNGGLDLGATITSVIFLIAIVVMIVYLIATKYDTIMQPSEGGTDAPNSGSTRKVWAQTLATMIVFLAVGSYGYVWSNDHIASGMETTQTTLTGQLNDFIQIENDIVADMNNGNLSSAKSSADVLEHDWDKSEPVLRKIDRKTWTRIDGTIDTVLAAVRTKNPNVDKSIHALQDSLNILNESNN